MISKISLNSFSGILLLLFATTHPPAFVNHTLVEFEEGLPFEMCI